MPKESKVQKRQRERRENLAQERRERAGATDPAWSSGVGQIVMMCLVQKSVTCVLGTRCVPPEQALS